MKTHPLHKFLEETGETQTGFAKRIGVSRMTIHRILKREGEFTTGLIKDVCQATNGTVEPSDFFEEVA